jgi:hypothetical protein
VSAYLDAPLEFHSNRNSAEASRTAVVSLTSVFTTGLLGLSVRSASHLMSMNV